MSVIELPQLQGHSLLTHSRLSTMKTCARKHYLRYEIGLVRDRGSTPLRIGSNVHMGLELLTNGKGIDAAIDAVCKNYADLPSWALTPEQVDEWYVECEKVLALITGYSRVYAADGFEVVASEISFDIPIRNPETGAPTPLFTFAGKIDRIIRLADGRLAVLETKTTSDSLDPHSDYWNRLRIDTQISGYMHAARICGHDVQTVVYDVIRKPSIRPKAVTKAERAAATANASYFGLALTETCPERETPQMFGARLLADIAERPEFYFCRREIPRMNSDLVEFEQELWDQTQIVRYHQKANRWPRSTAACVHPYKCEYCDVCFNGIDPLDGVPDGFKITDTAHPELA